VNRGATWTAANTGITKWEVISLAIDPLTPTTLYAGTHDGVYRSTDSGATWTAVNTAPAPLDVSSLAIDPKAPTILYAGTWYDGVFRSVNRGATWTAVNTGLPPVDVWCLAIDPLTPTTLYVGTWIVGTQGGVFRSTDSGGHWTAVNTGITGMTVYSLAIDPLTPSTLYAGTNGYVCRSTDSGATWMLVSIGRSYVSVTSLAIDSFTPSTLYAGTDSGGVFRSTDSGATWTVVKLGITSRDVTSLAIDPKTPSILYAGTQSGGVFRYGAASFYVLTTTASPSAGGSVRRSPKAATYAAGTVVTLTATPATGYTFTGWSRVLSGTKNPVTVMMDANKKLTASFAKKVKSVIQLKIGSRTMYVDGSPVVLEAAPIILNSRTLLPIRAIVEATGGTIAWEASTRKVTIVRKDKTLELWIGRNVATLNGKSVNIDSDPKVVPIIMSGRTLLPLRFVAEALALDVQWNATTQAITITYTP
ncbi:stalk domain-containing protein, partial [Candidatus Cryosericum septentrionale]